MDEELFNVVDDTQEPIVEAQDPTVDDGATPAEEPAQELAKPAQTAEENAAFAKVRREAEANAKKMADDMAAKIAQQKIDDFYKQNYGNQIDPYTGKPIDSEASYRNYERMQQIAEMASNNGITIDQQQELLKKALYDLPEYRNATETAKKMQEEAEAMREQLGQIAFQNDLNEVKKYNPKETAKSVEELGETFMRARAMGMEPITAYELAKAEKQRLNPAPPSMGDIKQNNLEEKEFYTSKEVDYITANTPEKLNDPKIWEKVRKSMTKWK